MNIKNFKIIHPKDLLLKVEDPKEVTSQTGIVLDLKPSILHDRHTKGEVIQIGSDIINIDIGDTVYFGKEAGLDLISENGYKYILLHYDRCLGLIKKQG